MGTGSGKYEQLLALCSGLAPATTVVAHPCEASALAGAIDAARLGLIRPILVGPEAKIASVARAAGLDLGDARIVDVPHSHAAATKAVALVRAGEAELLMKGSLHTDELMAAVVAKEGGLRTGRRISHVFLMDVPTYPKALIITDGAINIAPTLEDKVDIIQNAIDLAHALDVARPKVAILSAVETVTSKIPSTIDAAALCKMAERGQITGGILDGPLAFDNAISREAAATKGIRSEVAGDPDILVAPDLESGTSWPSSSASWPTPTAPAWCWAPACPSPHQPGRQHPGAHRELRGGAAGGPRAALGGPARRRRGTALRCRRPPAARSWS